MRIKIFIAESTKSMESRVNEFIEDEKIEVADIKITMSRVQIVCVLVYSPIKDETKK